VRRSVKYTKGKRPGRLVARSFEGWEKGKAGGRQIGSLYQRAKFVHARVVYINANKHWKILEQFHTPFLQQHNET
jgi:hypothetical protein